MDALLTIVARFPRFLQQPVEDMSSLVLVEVLPPFDQIPLDRGVAGEITWSEYGLAAGPSNIRSLEVQRVLAEQEFRMGGLTELVQFGQLYPDVRKTGPIAAVIEEYISPPPSGGRCVPYLSQVALMVGARLVDATSSFGAVWRYLVLL